jgi:hypothetical protein
MVGVIPNEGKVEIVTGDLGGGKTAYAVEMAYEQLASGGWVFTNIEILADKVRERLASEGLVFVEERLVFLQGDNMKAFYTQLRRGSDGEVVMCCVDEAHFDLNARNWKDTSEELIQFITLCRKLDIWLIFVTQDANDIDKQVRRKITVEVACRNLKEERIFGGIPFPVPVYFRVRFKMFQGRPHHKIDSEFYFRSPAWGLYRSKALLGSKAQVFAGMAVGKRERLARVQQTGCDWLPLAACVAAFLICAL